MGSILFMFRDGGGGVLFFPLNSETDLHWHDLDRYLGVVPGGVPLTYLKHSDAKG